MADKEQEHSQDTGQGTDLYIKKIAPGSQFGQGYMVEIYDYGEKVDERFVRTKKEVYQLVKEQKDRYHTDKAFENMQHLHVTFKSPGEQGFTQPKHSSLQGDSTMHIDEILLRKANQINNLLAALKDPTVPKKVFKSAEVASDQQAIVQQLKEELVSYFSNLDKDPNSQGYNPYNEIKEWLEKVRTLLTESNSNQGTNYDVNGITESLKDIFKNSGLPGEEILFKSACMEADKLVSQLNSKKDDLYAVNKVLKEGVSEDTIEQISKRPDKNEVEVLISKLHESCVKAQKFQDEFNSYEEDFWKHISNFKGVSPIEVVYADWEKSLTIDSNSKELLQSIILSSLEQNFKNVTRTADIVPLSIFQKAANYVLLPFLFNFKFAEDAWDIDPQELENQLATIHRPQTQEQPFLGMIDDLFKFGNEYLQRIKKPLNDREQKQVAEEIIQKYPEKNPELLNINTYTSILQTYIQEAVQEYVTTISTTDEKSTLDADFQAVYQDLQIHKIIEDLISAFRNLLELKYPKYASQYPQFQTYFIEIKNYVINTFVSTIRNIAQDQTAWNDVIKKAISEGKQRLEQKLVEQQKVETQPNPISNEEFEDVFTYIEKQLLRFGTTIIINEKDEEEKQNQIQVPSLESNPTSMQPNSMSDSAIDINNKSSIPNPQEVDVNTSNSQPLNITNQQEGKVLLDVLKG
jgi:hypothetical protein